MIETELHIINKLGLHARACAKLVTVTSRFQARIQLGPNGRLVDGKSIMAILMLGAKQGTVLKVQIDGDDEQDALTAVQELVANRFDEAE